MESTRIKLAALWTVVMFKADIIGFIQPGTLEQIIKGNFGFPISSELLLLFSVLTEVPIIMIFLNLVLPIKTSSWLNTIAMILTTLFVVGGGSATLSYFFFAAVEISSMIAILWYAWIQPSKTDGVITYGLAL